MVLRSMLVLLLVALVLVLAGCVTTPPPVVSDAVVSVVIDQGDVTVGVEASIPLSVTVEVVGSASTAVAWSSDDASVATVSDEGVVTGVAPGEATVTAASDFDGEKSASVVVTVVPAADPEVVGVRIVQGDQVLQVGEVLALSALVEVSEGASTGVSWASDDAGVVEVSDAGVVTGVAEGVAVVTATSDADPDWAASVTITVVAVATVDAVAVSVEPVDVTLIAGQSESFRASVVGTDDGGVLWSVTGGAIERSGATAVYTAPETAGTYFVTATSVVNPARSATSAVVVTSDDPDDEPVAARVEIVSDVSVVLAGIGESARFVAAVVRSDGSLDLDARVTWESSDPSAVEIDADGVVTAREAVGSAMIRAHYDALPAARGSVLVARVAEGARFVPRHLVEAVEQPAVEPSQLFGRSSALERVRVPNLYLTRRFVEGDKIASGPEDGLLHRIVRIEEAPLGGLWWWVEEIQMTDYFEDADFTAEGEPVTVEAVIDEGVMTLSTLSAGGVRTLAETRIIDTDRLKCTLSDGSDADINFSGTRFATTFQLVPVYDLRIRWFSIEEFRLGARLEMGFDAASGALSVDASVGAGVACELTLASLKVPLPVHAGPFTFAFNPSLKFRMEHGWEYDAGLFSFTGPAGSAGYEIEAGLLCSGGRGCEAYSSETDYGTFVPFEMGFELNAEYWLESRAALVLGAGVTANLGRTTLVGVDVFEGQLYTGLRLGTTVPLMPEISGYRGPNWDLVGGVRADLLLRVHAGDLQRLLRRVGLPSSASTEPLTLYEAPFFELASPDPTVAAAPPSVSRGSVTFTTTVPASSTERLVGARVEFWGAPEGSGIASLLASGTLSAAGTATATWTPEVDDNGSYSVAALVYDEVVEGFSFAYGSSDRATLTIAIGDDPGAVAVSLSPSNVTLPVNDTQSFTATVTGASDTSVTWDASCGSLSGSGNTVTYTAPGSAGECEVTATSVADPTKDASAIVTVTGGGSFEPAPSYISISNVSLAAASGGTRRVSFDISWDESWRGPSRPSWVEASDNWDAAWVFVKYRVSDGPWQHATLAPSGHVRPAGVEVNVTSDRVGAFIHRSSSGYGTFTANGVGLQWDYLADGVAAGAGVDVQPFGIEMVYVPQGSFSVGSGGSSTGEFRAGGTANTPFVVNSQSSITLGNAAGQLMWTTGGVSGSPSGSTTASFPTGYGAFYVMKYQVTQGQYVDFLNTLTQAQADARKHTEDRYRYAITGESVGSYGTTLPFVAMNYASWADGAAFVDWAGLRPMTELEFEKAARGPFGPVANEFAWGSTSITQATGLVNAGTIMETPTPAGANVNYWVSSNPIGGPVRVGSFAAPGRSRRDAGAGYYGALELSGNLWERSVTVGNVEGRAFTGAHGDGTLDVSGNANVSSWPGTTAVGAGFRGGGWLHIDGGLRVSNRYYAAYALAARSAHDGWRGARSGP